MFKNIFLWTKTLFFYLLDSASFFVFVSDFFLNQIWNSFFFFYYLLIGLSFFTSISSSSRLKRFESVFIGLVLLLASVFYWSNSFPSLFLFPLRHKFQFYSFQFTFFVDKYLWCWLLFFSFSFLTLHVFCMFCSLVCLIFFFLLRFCFRFISVLLVIVKMKFPFLLLPFSQFLFDSFLPSLGRSALTEEKCKFFYVSFRESVFKYFSVWTLSFFSHLFLANFSIKEMMVLLSKSWRRWKHETPI